MRLLLATDKLVVQGRTFEGFPLLISGGKPVEPAQTFLWDHLAKSGRRQSKLTWEKYGRSLFDFFAFCEVNKADWKAAPPIGLPSTIHWYRDWARGEVGNSEKTVNHRLRLIVKFYEWALANALIDHLPFSYEEVENGRSPGMLAHVDATGGKALSPDVLLIEKKTLPKLLTKEQVHSCLGSLTNNTHRLMFELMVRTGLRQVECRTFPSSYVFDPARRRDLKEGCLIRMALDPRDMKLKFDKPREIDVPYSLMEDLWWYSIRYRTQRARRVETNSTALFLTESGARYAATSLTDIFAGLQRKVGFLVRPHMLRHTYATYTLMSLRKSAYEGDPLIYVRDRLGHANITSTAVYLHLIDKLASQLILQHEAELDELFAQTE